MRTVRTSRSWSQVSNWRWAALGGWAVRARSAQRQRVGQYRRTQRARHATPHISRQQQAQCTMHKHKRKLKPLEMGKEASLPLLAGVDPPPPLLAPLPLVSYFFVLCVALQSSRRPKMRTESPWQLANLSPAPSAVLGKLSVFWGWEVVVRTGKGLKTGAHMGRVLNDRDTANSRRWACKCCSCGTVPRASSFSRPASEAAAPGGPPILRQRAVCGKCGGSR